MVTSPTMSSDWCLMSRRKVSQNACLWHIVSLFKKKLTVSRCFVIFLCLHLYRCFHSLTPKRCSENVDAQTLWVSLFLTKFPSICFAVCHFSLELKHSKDCIIFRAYCDRKNVFWSLKVLKTHVVFFSFFYYIQGQKYGRKQSRVMKNWL